MAKGINEIYTSQLEKKQTKIYSILTFRVSLKLGEQSVFLVLQL